MLLKIEKLGWKLPRILVSFCLIACVHPNEIQKPSILQFLLLGSTNNSLGAITSDFGGGGRWKVIETNSLIPLPGSTPIHSDAKGRYFQNRVFIVNRLGKDSIQRLNSQLSFVTEMEFSVGQGSNPQDIWVMNDGRAFVSFYNGFSLGIFDSNSGTRIGSIDLSQFKETTSNSDNALESSGLHLVGSSLYLALQRLDRNDPRGYLPANSESLLIEINSNSGNVINSYVFPARNPFTNFQQISLRSQAYLTMSCGGNVGFLSQIDGGIYAFSLESKSFLPNPLLSEAAVGGDILAFSIWNESLGVASVLTPNFTKKVVLFRPITGEVVSTLLEIPPNIGTSITGILVTPEGKLFLGNTDLRNPGVSVYDLNQGARPLLPSPLGLELTPFQFLLLQNPN